jgi:transposase
MSIPGVNREAAQIILAEIGIDMSRFPTDGHLCRWAGVASGNNESGGKRYSGRTTKSNRTLKSTLVQCAYAAIRTKASFFKARYHRLAARRGKKRAVMAIAHSMLRAIWHMLRTGEVYPDLGADYYNQRNTDAKVAYHTRQLEKLTGATVQIALVGAAA